VRRHLTESVENTVYKIKPIIRSFGFNRAVCWRSMEQSNFSD